MERMQSDPGLQPNKFKDVPHISPPIMKSLRKRINAVGITAKYVP